MGQQKSHPDKITDDFFFWECLVLVSFSGYKGAQNTNGKEVFTQIRYSSPPDM
jgi:hypothetical protein